MISRLRLYLYIFGELLAPYLLSLFILLMTILMVQMFRFTDVILIYGSDLDSTLLLLKSLLISTFPIIIPLSFLSAILLGYGRMSQDSELVALSALGYSKKQLLFPALVLCLMSFIFCFYCVTELGPKGVKISKILSTQIASETLSASLKPGVFLTIDNMTVYVESLDKNNQEFKNFFVLDQRTDKPAVVFSQTGKIINKEDKFSYLQMGLGQIHFNPKEANHAVIDFKEYNFVTDNEAKGQAGFTIRGLTNKEIFEYKNKNLKSKSIFDYNLEIHKRYQLSIVCFVFLALGIAFGFNIFQRVTRSESLGLCLFFAMAYWIIYFIFESMASNAHLIFYVYIPNILFLSLALLWMFYKNDSFIGTFNKKKLKA